MTRPLEKAPGVLGSAVRGLSAILLIFTSLACDSGPGSWLSGQEDTSTAAAEPTGAEAPAPGEKVAPDATAPAEKGKEADFAAAGVEGETDVDPEKTDDDGCREPPEGMVCIPGGPAVIGSNDHTAKQLDAEQRRKLASMGSAQPIAPEKPEHVVNISTFYMDRHEVTNAEFEKCEQAGACPKRNPKKLPSSYANYMKKPRPATPITWFMAHAYCKWAGKRLPTEAEWEKVARGGDKGNTYPWGNAEPTCDAAAYRGCKPRTTRPVESFPPGAYGVYDMAGNGYEWVNDWGSDCYKGCENECGDACMGDDPQGPCAGAPSCAGHTKRVLRGGSWYWPSNQMRGAWRRFHTPASGIHRLSFRCASSTPQLALQAQH